jgi:hypothetical protein
VIEPPQMTAKPDVAQIISDQPAPPPESARQ